MFCIFERPNSLLCWNGLYPRVTHHFASFCLLINCPPFSWWQFTKNRPILQDLAYPPSSLGQLGGWLFHVNLPSNHPHLRERWVLLMRSSPLRNGTSKVNGEACRHAKRSLAQVLWYCVTVPQIKMHKVASTNLIWHPLGPLKLPIARVCQRYDSEDNQDLYVHTLWMAA